jgi:hypothetical protein
MKNKLASNCVCMGNVMRMALAFVRFAKKNPLSFFFFFDFSELKFHPQQEHWNGANCDTCASPLHQYGDDSCSKCPGSDQPCR